MSSSFSWHEYSENDRRKAIDVIDIFRERDKRDQMGDELVSGFRGDWLDLGAVTSQLNTLDL